MLKDIIIVLYIHPYSYIVQCNSSSDGGSFSEFTFLWHHVQCVLGLLSDQPHTLCSYRPGRFLSAITMGPHMGWHEAGLVTMDCPATLILSKYPHKRTKSSCKKSSLHTHSRKRSKEINYILTFRYVVKTFCLYVSLCALHLIRGEILTSQCKNVSLHFMYYPGTDLQHASFSHAHCLLQ